MELIDLEEQPLELLRVYRNKDITAFRKILDDGCNVNFIFSEETYKPILGVLASDLQPGKLRSFLCIFSILLAEGINVVVM